MGLARCHDTFLHVLYFYYPGICKSRRQLRTSGGSFNRLCGRKSLQNLRVYVCLCVCMCVCVCVCVCVGVCVCLLCVPPLYCSTGGVSMSFLPNDIARGGV